MIKKNKGRKKIIVLFLLNLLLGLILISEICYASLNIANASSSNLTLEDSSKLNIEDIPEKKYYINKNIAELYIKNLYKNVLEREATESEINYWYSEYIKNDNNVYIVTNGIILGKESYEKNGKKELNTKNICKNAYKYIIGTSIPQNIEEVLNKVYNEINDNKSIIKIILNSSEFEEKIKELEIEINSIVERSLNSKLMSTINFENLSLIGDVNGDGKINLTDTRIIALYIEDCAKGFDMSEYEFIKEYGDVNGDGRITSMDVRWTGLYENAKFVRREEFTLQELIENFDNWFKEDEDGIYYVIG